MSPAPRVLMVARQFPPAVGGVERCVDRLSAALVQRGCPTDVLTLDRTFDRMDVRLPAYEVRDGVHVHRVPFRGRGRVFLAPHALARVRGYDLVHVHDVDAFGELLAATRWWHGRPLVLTTHGGFFHTRRWAVAKKAYFHTLSRASLRAFDAVIAVSEHDRALFSRIAESVQVISNGVDREEFGGVEKAAEPGRLLSVSRLAANKRIDRLLRALAVAARELPTIRLELVGPDSDGLQPGLARLAGELGVADRVQWHGVATDADVKGHLVRAHLFVSASEYEAFGISALEAMASGTVPCVSDIEAFREWIVPGVNGFLIDFADPDRAGRALAEAVRTPVERLRSMAASAKQTADRYAWSTVAARHEALYREVLARR